MANESDQLDLTSSHSTAWHLTKLGYQVLPIVHGSKACTLRNWTELRIPLSGIDTHFAPAADNGVGVLLGTEVLPGIFIVAIDIDIDDPNLISRVLAAIGGAAPAKRGSKGITFFVRTEGPMKARRLRRKDPVTGSHINALEILATGEQTVIPPSLHPKGMYYEWIGEPLTSFPPNTLPFLDQYAIAEIELAVKKPDSALFFINTMLWAGPGGGGDIHNSVLSAVAVMVGMNWPDDVIWRRVDAATAQACARVGEAYDWPGWDDIVAKQILDARNKGFADNKKRNPHLDAARWFVDDWHGPGHVRRHQGQVMCYQEGYYTKMDEQEIRHVLAVDYPEPPNVSFVHNNWVTIARTALDVAAPFPRPEDRRPARRVCFRNGTFDLDACELGPHSQEDYLLAQLPFDYDPAVTCPIYDRFIAETWPKDVVDDDPGESSKCVNTFEEFAAHTLFECLDYQKFLILKGPPNTGKSTLLHIVRSLHSKHATASVAVHQFQDDRYRTTLVGKLVNLTGEVNTSSYLADDFLKQVTAGDPVDLRLLFNEPFSTILPTRFIFACNEMFRIRDTSGAVERRMLILGCTNPIAETDTGLWAKLVEERAGIFNRWVTAWQRLRDRGKFDPPEQHLIDVAEFSQDQNHVLQWLIESTYQGRALDDAEYICPPDAAPTEVGELFGHFREWAKNYNYLPMSIGTWSNRLKDVCVRLKLPAEPGKKKLPNGVGIRTRPLTLIRHL